MHSGLLAWYGRIDDPARKADLCATLGGWLDAARHGVASTHPADPTFEPQRYWRGPIWPHVNWLIAEGCAHQGLQVLHDRIRASTRELLETGGLYEYFDPETGRGYGGDSFSWTAAIALYWLDAGPAGMA